MILRNCKGCEQRDAKIAKLQARVATLEEELHTLRDTVTQLQEHLAAAKKTSSTSSKPPSSDIVKAPKNSSGAETGTAKPGGQPGHEFHARTLLPPESLNGGSHEHRLPYCPDCGQDLLPSTALPRVIQQVEIREIPLHIEEHRSLPGWCPHCHKVHYAALPAVIDRGGLAGPRLTTLIAYLKGVCHASYSTIRTFVRDVVKVTISRSELCSIVTKVAKALAQPYDELLRDLPQQAALNVDETGHKDNGVPWWTWCFRASLYTVFKIDAHRSAEVLMEVLGREFEGVVGCDYFGAYRRYMRECSITLQFCLAHFIREVKFLLTLPDPAERAYGERLCGALRNLFGVIHRREELTAKSSARQLSAARAELLRVGTTDVPSGNHSRNLAARLEKYGDSYFRFITTPGVEPTNNLAEQAIRFVVLDRKVTQGTRSAAGREWCERIWTVIATCAQQGRSVFEYLSQAVEALFHGTEPPSLLPAGTAS